MACAHNCAAGGIITKRICPMPIKTARWPGPHSNVYEVEPRKTPLRELEAVIMTPHLGASTEEAQEAVGIEIAEQIADVLAGGTIRNAVNMPTIDAKVLAVCNRIYIRREDGPGYWHRSAPRHRTTRH